jgi:hypothetical protein
MSTPREYFEANIVPRSLGLGAITAVMLYFSGCLEASILLAMMMPGVYWGFAFCGGGWLEVVEESITCSLLIYVYLQCLRNVQDMVYLAPLSVAIHGVIDFLHYFSLYPSSKHVHTCCPKYPLLCGCIDISLSVTLAGFLYFFGIWGVAEEDET